MRFIQVITIKFEKFRNSFKVVQWTEVDISNSDCLTSIEHAPFKSNFPLEHLPTSANIERATKHVVALISLISVLTFKNWKRVDENYVRIDIWFLYLHTQINLCVRSLKYKRAYEWNGCWRNPRDFHQSYSISATVSRLNRKETT